MTKKDLVIMVRIMVSRRLFSTPILFYLITVGCQHRQPPEVAPYSYVPHCPSDVWETSEKNLRQNEKISSRFCEVIPAADTPLDLAGMFEIALSNNPETTRTWAMAKEASAAYGIARADFYPKLTLDTTLMNYSQGLVVSNGSILLQSQTQVTPVLELTYTFWDFGERIYKSREYMYALDYANWTHNQTIQTVMNKVADSYYNYLYQDALTTAIEKDLEDAWRAFDAANQRMETGIADVTDFLQAKTTYLQKKVALASQEGSEARAKIALLNHLGLRANQPICLGCFPEKAPLEKLTRNADYLMCIAEQDRPDIRAARSNVASKEAAFERAKAAAMPKITGTADAGYTWFFVNPTSIKQYLLELDLSIPIFAGFYYENQIRLARAELDVARAELQTTELQAGHEVMDAFTNFRVATISVPLTDDYLVSAQKELDSVLAHYKQGTNTIVDVLNSLASLSDARAKYVQTMYELFSSMIDLSFATGTLYYSSEIAPENPNNQNSCHESVSIFEHQGDYEPTPATDYTPIPGEMKSSEDETVTTLGHST